MAGIRSGTKLTTVTWGKFDTIYKPGNEVPASGIYKCKNCNREITSNAHPEDNTFPPHNSSSNCKNAEWKAHVLTDTKGNEFINK